MYTLIINLIFNSLHLLGLGACIFSTMPLFNQLIVLSALWSLWLGSPQDAPGNYSSTWCQRSFGFPIEKLDLSQSSAESWCRLTWIWVFCQLDSKVDHWPFAPWSCSWSSLSQVIYNDGVKNFGSRRLTHSLCLLRRNSRFVRRASHLF